MRRAAHVLATLTTAGSLMAERLPVRVYTPADGLAGIAVHRIVADSHGFLWLCTGEGLSRFDGYGFTNYTAEHGLPDTSVYDLLETENGVYWVATRSGLCRFDANQAGRRVQVHLPPGGSRAKFIHVLRSDPSGAIWVGTDVGLFRLERVQEQRRTTPSGEGWVFRAVDLGRPEQAPTARAVFAVEAVFALLHDRRGNLWAGTGSGLYQLKPGGKVERYSRKQGLPADQVFSLLEDSRGRIWAGTPNGLALLSTASYPQGDIVERLYTTRDGLPSNWVYALLSSSSGTLWAGTLAGVAELTPSDENHGLSFRAYTSSDGLSDDNIHALAEDRDGNLWIGTDTAGAMKVVSGGFLSFDERDGLGSRRVVSMFEDRTGTICVVTRAPGRLFINRFDGRGFTAARLNVPPAFYPANWLGWYQVAVESQRGEWWVASAAGLLRFPAVRDFRQLATAAPLQRYRVQDGLIGDHVHQIFEDRGGYIWISTRDPRGNGISRWDPASKRLHTFSTADGLPPLDTMHANGFFEDRAGQVWIGLHRAGAIRYARGRFEVFTESDGIPAGGIRRFHQDRQGRLWLGSGQGGIARLDNPEAERPRFTIYGTAQGLSGNEIQAITEDQWGRIYIGTGQGVDRLDPASGSVRHYTTSDGLAAGEVQTAMSDREGNLWFGTVQGVARLTPAPDRPRPPPPVRIMGLRIAGTPFPVAAIGETVLHLPDLSANRNQVQIDSLGVSFAPGEVLQYQYRFENGGEGWSPPTTQRSVIYAGVAPGRYRFLVRALNSDGAVSPQPASVVFRVLPPLWTRPWFLALAAACVACAIYAASHYRMKRLLEVERLRTRIASDLHDEIGSGLSQIAVLSEVAQKVLPDSVCERLGTLPRIAEISRELVDSMSDIVWAINPQKDRVGDLTQRMRRFAGEVLGAAGIELEFHSSRLDQEKKIGPEARRQIYLIFRETVRNVLRHAHCQRVEVHLNAEDGWLLLRVIDNGIGFDPDGNSEGHGLKSMRERAEALGGRIEWASSGGTTVTLRAPT